MFPRSFWTFYQAVPSWINEKLRILKTLKKKIKYKKDTFFVLHHMAHSAGSFLSSPFEKAAIVTILFSDRGTPRSFRNMKIRQNKKKKIKSIDKALDLLEFLSINEDEIGIAQISKEVKN